MLKKSRLLILAVAMSFILLMLFSLACASRSASVPTEPTKAAATPTPTQEQTPSPSPAPAPLLTMEQKAAMVWTGDNYESCYPMNIIVFPGTVNGENRLIWTYLKDKQGLNDYFAFEPFDATELLVYDLLNREYLFTISLPQGTLVPDPFEFTQYITDRSPAMSNFTFHSSMDVMNLAVLYSVAEIDSAEIQDVDGLINSYIFIEPNTIGQWNKSKAIEAYCAVTPEDYILPYWEYVPNTVKPVDFDSIGASAATPVPTVKYTQEQKELLLGGKLSPYPMTFGDIDVFLCKVNGNLRILWTVNYRNMKDSNDEYYAVDYHSAFNDEYLFTLRTPMAAYEDGLLVSDTWKYFFKSSIQLEGMKLIGSSSLHDISKAYSTWEIPYTGNERIDSLASAWEKGDYSVVDMPVSQEEIEELYLDTVPDAYLMPFWEYVPNAVTPDAFLAPTPTSAATTAP